MKKYLMMIIIGLFCVFILMACSKEDHTGEVKIPDSSDNFTGKNYKDVKTQFESNGFNNIEEEKMDDLITGWITKDGEVEEVSIGGKTEFSVGRWVPEDTKVIIRYHTFPEDDENTNNNVQDNIEVNKDEWSNHILGNLTYYIPNTWALSPESDDTTHIYAPDQGVFALYMTDPMTFTKNNCDAYLQAITESFNNVESVETNIHKINGYDAFHFSFHSDLNGAPGAITGENINVGERIIYS